MLKHLILSARLAGVYIHLMFISHLYLNIKLEHLFWSDGRYMQPRVAQNMLSLQYRIREKLYTRSYSTPSLRIWHIHTKLCLPDGLQTIFKHILYRDDSKRTRISGKLLTLTFTYYKICLISWITKCLFAYFQLFIFYLVHVF